MDPSAGVSYLGAVLESVPRVLVLLVYFGLYELPRSLVEHSALHSFLVPFEEPVEASGAVILKHRRFGHGMEGHYNLKYHQLARDK